MSTREVITVVGTVIGAVYGYPQLGYVAGSLIGNAVDPQQIKGPKLEDLKTAALEYGSPVAHTYGCPRLAGAVAWSSDKQEVESTDGGKGGPEVTEYTYKQDVLYLLAANEVGGIRRIFSNGKLIWTAASDATPESIEASGQTVSWDAIEVFTGAEDQLPWSVYEAAVGVGNAPAMRGRLTVGITGLNLGSSGYAPQLTFEIGSATVVPEDDAKTIFPWSFVTSSGGGCVQSPYPVHDDCNASAEMEFVVRYPGYTGYTFPPFSTLADALDEVQEIAASGLVSGGVYTPGLTYVGYYTSLNPVPNYFAGGATLDGDPEYVFLLFAPQTIESVDVNANSGMGGVCQYLEDASVVPAASVTSADMRVSNDITGPSGYAGYILVNTDEDGAIGGPSLTFNINVNNCTNYPPVGLYYPATIAAAFTCVQVKRKRSCEPTCESLAHEEGGARALIGYEWYADSGGPGGTVGGHLVQVPVGPVLLVGDENFDDEDWWRARAAELSIDLTGRSFMTSPGDTGGSASTLALNRFATFVDATCRCDAGLLDATPADLADVVFDLCTRSGLDGSYVDVEQLRDIPVRALAVSQVTPARQVIELLMGAYFFSAVEGTNLKFVLRGGASEGDLPYSALGASEQGGATERLPISRRGDIEIPAQFAITYANTLADQQAATEYSDRLIGRATGVTAIQMPLGFQPQEAKRIAEANLLDAVMAAVSIGPIGLNLDWVELEPTDVYTLFDESGSSFRVRVVKVSDEQGVRKIDLVLDDATALNSTALTDSNYVSNTVVQALLLTDLLLLDIPIQRDGDNDPGHYAAFAPMPGLGLWPGAKLYRGIDDTGYAELLKATDRTVTGVTTTMIGEWDGGWVFDEVNTVRVSVNGPLFNYTRDQIINGTAPMYMIGKEEIYARTATLLAPGLYELSGLLRGRRGTEWAVNSGHVVGERVVLMQTSGLRRVPMESGQLGSTFSYKAPTFGRSLSSAEEQEFVNTGVGAKPFSPVDARFDRNVTTNDVEITWTRRTRMSTRLTGDAGISAPLGEAVELYQVDLYSVDSPVAFLRTVTTSSPSVVYTAAQQGADGLAVGAGFEARIYQMSAIVGRGYPLIDEALPA